MTSTKPLSAPAVQTRTFKPIITKSSNKRKLEQQIHFNPSEHLAFEPPESTITMEDIGYASDLGVSPVAVSQPFQLFTPDAVQTFRDEVLHPEVMEKCFYSGNLGACYLRGHVPKYAPFTHSAWTNPTVLSTISKIAGVDLVPSMNYEIAHINISVKSSSAARAELEAVDRERQAYAADEGIAGCPWEDDDDGKPVVNWHVDSYPFVCVTMLSDCTDMIGGETALRTKKGEVMKVRGPQMGCAVIMQGRYITHQALRALGAQERITMVTSFRPASPHLRDDSDLSTVRGISDLSTLYYEFSSYRLEMLEERVRKQLKSLRETFVAGRKTDTKALKAFFAEQVEFLRATDEEIVPDELVVKGMQPEVQVADEGGDAEDEGRPVKRAKVV